MKNDLQRLCVDVTCAAVLVACGSAFGQSRTYTLDADFDEGTLINVNHDAPNNDQLQMNNEAEPFPFINVAASARGTIVRINTTTGAIIGEYQSAPDGRARNPSRTTVDRFGNVWAGNRDEAGGGLGSVVKIGLIVGGTRVDADGTPNPTGGYLAPPFAYSTCVDRDNDGLIRTSIGLGDILAWPDVTDGVGGTTALVEDAEDECIQIFQRVNADFARHVSVDANNNVWTGGNFGSDNAFDLLDGDTGQILASFDVGRGGYGGLVDGNDVLWSANRGPGALALLRYETKGTNDTSDDVSSILVAPNSYGLGLDSSGNIWHAQFTANNIRKYDSSGALLGVFGTGGASGDRGVAVTPADDNVWVANSSGNDVSRLANDGTLLKVISLGGDGVTPTGVAVDAAGKVWAACLSSSTVKRIDPNGGGDGLGAVDLTVSLGLGAGPYNYSDMTGTVLFEAIQQGTWSVVYDTGMSGTSDCAISWNSEEPDGTSITTEVRAADAEGALGGETFIAVANGESPAVSGQFWEIQVNFSREVDDTTPILFDLTIECNMPPVCPEGMGMELWPPNHKPREIDLDALAGVTDPDGDAVMITITSITQDEPINDLGDGNTTCDGQGVGGSVAFIRSERQGGGNGRVYHINYTADDGVGGTCDGTFTVTVPHSRNGDPAVDDGQDYDSTACFDTADVNADGRVDLLDLEIVVHNMGASGPDDNLNWPDGDVDKDGSVTYRDLMIVLGIIFMEPRRPARFGIETR